MDFVREIFGSLRFFVGTAAHRDRDQPRSRDARTAFGRARTT